MTQNFGHIKEKYNVKKVVGNQGDTDYWMPNKAVLSPQRLESKYWNLTQGN